MIPAAGLWWLLAGFAVLALGCCALALGYARQRQLLDLPGERRSHAVATPRGGGAGMVLALLIAMLTGAWMLPEWRVVLMASAAGLVLVAGIGWWDDHRPLPAMLRLCVHMLAATIVAWLLWRDGAGLIWAVVAFGLCVGLVNIWNFMDGINGLATSQAALAALALAWLMPGALALPALLVAVACLSFLPFNFPRARIFMGDVGSGALGFVLALLVLLALRRGPETSPLLWLWPLSVFLIDAGFTLMTRIWRGDAWMQAHTEHLYQWYVKRGVSHARVTLGYGAITAAMGISMLAMEARAQWTIVLASLLLWTTGAACWYRLRSGLMRRHA